MKKACSKLIVILITIHCSLFTLIAQAPQKINYQAVARDNVGDPLKNKAISIRVAILNFSSTGSKAYQETHNVTTTEFGLFSLAIGTGTPEIGTFINITWDLSDKFVKIDMDPSGGTNFSSMGTAQLLSVPYALHADKATSLSPTSKINLSQLNSTGISSGQVLQWNGTQWVGATMSGGGGGGSDNWGTQTVVNGSALTGSGTTSSPLNLASQGATSGQVLQYNGSAWIPATPASGGSDNWGTQTALTSGALSGNGTAGNAITIAQNGATSGQALVWNGTAWTPSTVTGSDDWGTQSAATNATLSGNGTTGNPLGLGQNGATNGQVLKWNGTSWSPAIDGGDDWGAQTTTTSATLSGNGTTGSPLKIAQNGATSGQFLQWNGTDWIPVTASAGGDNWGTQTTITSGTGLSGNGTTANPLKLAQQSATSGQFLQWNGTDWVPVTASVGGDNWGTQTASVGNGITGNGTVANPLKLAQQSATTGQLLQWNGSGWGPVSLSGDNWGTQTVIPNATLSGAGTSASPIGLAQQGATTGQIMTWTGSAWAPTTLSSSADNWGTQTVSSTPILSGNGTVANPLTLAQQAATSGQVMTWTGTTWAPTTISGGDNWGTQTVNTTTVLSGNGTVANPLTIAQQGATLGKVLKWNGTAWAPANDSIGAGGGGSYTSNNAITLSGSNFALGGALANPTVITTAGANTLSLAGLNSGTLTDSLVVTDAVTGVLRRISPSRISSGGGGSYTASNGITLTGSNFTLGGALTGPTVITTTPTNNLALPGLLSGFDSDSIMTINATNNIINRQSKSRVNFWSRDAAFDLSYKAGRVSIGTDSSRAKFQVYNSTTLVDTAAIITSISSAGGQNTGLIVNGNNTGFIGAGIGVRASGGFAGIISNAQSTGAAAASNHYGVLGQSTGLNTVGTIIGVRGFADTIAARSYGMQGVGAAIGGFFFPSLNNQKATLLGFGFNGDMKVGTLGLVNGANLDKNNSLVGSFGFSGGSNTFVNCGVNGYGKSPIGSDWAIGVLAEAAGGDSFQVASLNIVDTPNRGNSLILAQWNSGDVLTQGDYFNTGDINNTKVFTNDSFIIANDTLFANGGIVSLGKARFIDTVLMNKGLNVAGNISKGSSTFKIDHPLDPANKFLIHSVIESPDMMNIYNGNIETDTKGFATVHLPDYFELINKDYRYQLTAIGVFSQVIVKEKIKDNVFIIQTEKPNVEVSWQITGIRKDPFAEANRIIDVVQKSELEKGKFIHPELYNQPIEKGMYYTGKTIKENKSKINAKLKVEKIKNLDIRKVKPRKLNSENTHTITYEEVMESQNMTIK